MNEQIIENTTKTRKLTDTALLIVAFAAVATWLWRRLRGPATVDTASENQRVDDAVSGTVDFPPNNAPV